MASIAPIAVIRRRRAVIRLNLEGESKGTGLDTTALAASHLLVQKALDAYGLDSQALFERAGLDPDSMRDPEARYSEAASTKLFELAREVTGDPCFGLKLASYWHPSSLHALGFAWMASASLKEALERLVRYFRILIVGEHLALEETQTEYQLHIKTLPEYPRAPEEVYDAFIAVLVNMCRKSYGDEFNPLKVVLRRPAPPCSGEFYAQFRAPVDFGADADAVLLDKQQLVSPLPTANAQMALASDQIIADYLWRLDRSQVAVQVKAKLIERLPSGQATEEGIAEALNVSLRSLQRRLRDEETSYSQLLDETRRELAMQYIRRSRMSINEITYLLGFSEPSNFSRAFKRWTGHSPTEHRQTR